MRLMNTLITVYNRSTINVNWFCCPEKGSHTHIRIYIQYSKKVNKYGTAICLRKPGVDNPNPHFVIRVTARVRK